MTTAGSHRAPVDLFEPEAAAVFQTAAHRAFDMTPSPSPLDPATPSASSRHRTAPSLSRTTIYQLLGLFIALALVAAGLLRFG